MAVPCLTASTFYCSYSKDFNCQTGFAGPLGARKGSSPMFNSPFLAGDTTRAIVVQTRTGHSVVNEITLPPSPKAVAQFTALTRRFANWQVRKPPTGGYNCAGHVWASRRTGIFDDLDAQALQILNDDGYRPLGGMADARPGDLALYWETVSPRTNLHHVGIVFELRSPLLVTGGQKLAPHPWVLSKFDAFAGEALHHFSEVFFYENAEFTVEFWTDRP